jgi:hypothetical protein
LEEFIRKEDRKKRQEKKKTAADARAQQVKAYNEREVKGDREKVEKEKFLRGWSKMEQKFKKEDEEFFKRW